MPDEFVIAWAKYDRQIGPASFRGQVDDQDIAVGVGPGQYDVKVGVVRGRR
jgi:hypothetical protein